METPTKTRYAGADWLKLHLKFARPDMTVSPFGERVAELLGELFGGLYHLDLKSINRAGWSDDRYIEISFYSNGMSTFDFDDLTRLVFLAHHLAIRVVIKPCNMHYLRLAFSPRGRKGDLYIRHPCLDEAVENFKAYVNLPEVGWDGRNKGWRYVDQRL